MNWITLFRSFILLLTLSFGANALNAQCTADIPYPIDDPCVQIVIANDAFCCNNTWDGLCQSSYDDCDPGGGGCTAIAPYPADDPCYIEVILNDTYCCDTSWDGACQSAYDMCDPGGGGGGPITVSDDTYTVPELITEVLLGSCVEASNITFSGADGAFGNFSGGNDIGFEEGIILSTGNAIEAPGPENGIITTAHNTPGDPDLEALSDDINFETNDAAIVEFDFVSPSDVVTFEYFFASSEYTGFTCGDFNDVFGFFVNGPGFAPNTNVSLVPGTTTPVSINTVNSGTATDITNCLAMDPNFADYSIYFNENVGSASTEEIGYNGYTDVFTVELELEPCETYTIKLAIADGGDTGWDSAVFLKGGSFTSGLEVDVVSGTSTASIDALEGCEDGYFMFINQGPEITEPTDFEFEIGGTATMGDDYAPINDFVTFQPGQDTVIVSIEAFLDGIDEGTETIVLTFPDACTCDDAPEAVLNILDNDELTAEISEDVTICTGNSTTLEVLNAEGSESTPYTYEWSNGADTPSIDVSPAATTTYDVTVTDACGGQSVELEVTVTVADEITVDIDAEICNDETYELPDGTSASDPGLYTFDFLTDQGCDSIVNINLEIIDVPETVVETGVCEGESYTLPDDTEVDEAGSYDVILTSVDGCDSLVTTELEIWPNYEVDEDAAICEGDTYTLPDGTVVDAADTYSVTLQSVNGCDSIVNTTLEVYPTYSQNVNEFVCGDGGYTLPDGTDVFVTGEYEVILTTINGCDSVITTFLEVQDLVTVDLEPVICDNQSYTLPDGTNANTTGIYDVMVGAEGCDTLYVVDLVVHPTYEFTIQDTICAGEEYPLPDGEVVSTGGNYSAMFQTVNGCDSLYNVQLVVLDNPVSSFSADPRVASVYDGPVQFFNESEGATSQEWEIEDYGTFEEENPVIDFNGIAGTYDVCLYTENDFGCNDLYCILYEVREDFTVYIPNAFSPNGDGINDLFYVQGMDIDPQDFLLQVFNRYGELVFETKDPTKKWNGEEPGKEHYAETEIYVYRVTVGSLSAMEKQEFTGQITALR